MLPSAASVSIATLAASRSRFEHAVSTCNGGGDRPARFGTAVVERPTISVEVPDVRDSAGATTSRRRGFLDVSVGTPEDFVLDNGCAHRLRGLPASPPVSPASGHRWAPWHMTTAWPVGSHHLHHILGRARGAPRSPHCGHAWRPRCGPLDGPFTCRLRATRHVEGGTRLLIGGGPRRDLGAARRLL